MWDAPAEPRRSGVRVCRTEWLDDSGKTGWKLHFHFTDNEYLANKVPFLRTLAVQGGQKAIDASLHDIGVQTFYERS